MNKSDGELRYLLAILAVVARAGRKRVPALSETTPLTSNGTTFFPRKLAMKIVSKVSAWSLSLVLVVILAGCTSPTTRAMQRASSHVRFERVDSASVEVATLYFKDREGIPHLAGNVRRAPGAADTSRTHLDITVKAADGRVLAEQVTRFAPANVPCNKNAALRRSRFALPLDTPLSEIAVITVRAHDGPHISEPRS